MKRNEIIIDGIRYVPSRTAAQSVNLVPDYVTRLCRLGLVRGKRSQGVWYVDERSLRTFVEVKQQHLKEAWRRQSELLKQELRASESETIAESLRVIPTVIAVAPAALHKFQQARVARAVRQRAMAITS